MPEFEQGASETSKTG